MLPLDIVRQMQQASFAGDWDGFRSLFRDDTYYRVGNVAQVTGARAIADWLQEMLAADVRITGMDVRGAWQTKDAAVMEFNMQGTRLHDNKPLSYPCIDIYRFADDKFRDWRVYPIAAEFIDSSRHIAAEPAPPVQGAHGGFDSSGMAVVNAFQAALGKADWDTAKSILAEDVLLRIANQAERVGPQAVLDALLEVFSSRLQPTGAEFLDAWQFDDVFVVELRVSAIRVRDRQRLVYPCVESYRFRGNRIREYRIYPIEPTLLDAEPAA